MREKPKSLPHNKFTHVNAPAASGIPAVPYLGMTCQPSSRCRRHRKNSPPQTGLRERQHRPAWHHATTHPRGIHLASGQRIGGTIGSAKRGQSNWDYGTNRRLIPPQSGTHPQRKPQGPRPTSTQPNPQLKKNHSGAPAADRNQTTCLASPGPKGRRTLCPKTQTKGTVLYGWIANDNVPEGSGSFRKNSHSRNSADSRPGQPKSRAKTGAHHRTGPLLWHQQMIPELFLELKRFDSSVAILLIAEGLATEEIFPQYPRIAIAQPSKIRKVRGSIDWHQTKVVNETNKACHSCSLQSRHLW